MSALTPSHCSSVSCLADRDLLRKRVRDLEAAVETAADQLDELGSFGSQTIDGLRGFLRSMLTSDSAEEPACDYIGKCNSNKCPKHGAAPGADSVGGDGCTAGDGKAIDCRHCGAPPGVTCADHKAQRSSEAQPSDETLDDRTSLLNDVCNWLNEHGYGAAARHLHDVRSNFQLAPQRTETPIPLVYETGYREGQSSVLADVDHILDEADSDADALAALRKLVSSETGSTE